MQENRFKVISSAKGHGAFCVISGDFNGREGLIRLRVHQRFKILTTILMLLPIIAMALSLLRRDLNNSIGLVFPVLLGILFVRCVIWEMNFRIISKKTLARFTETIKISEIKNVAK